MPPNVNTVGTVRIEVGPKQHAPVNQLVFPVNPNQDYTRDIRVTVTQTEGGFYTDDYDMGVPTLQLSGSTGFQSEKGRFNGAYVDGNAAGKHLYRDILNYYFSRERNNQASTMWVYDDVFGRAFEVKPIGQMQTNRDSTDPMVIHFQQQFVVLQDYPFHVTQQKIPDPIVQLTKPKPSPQPAKVATKAKQTPYHIYVVKPDDNLWDISRDYLGWKVSNTTIYYFVQKIARLNHIPNPDLIFPGQKFKIPNS